MCGTEAGIKTDLDSAARCSFDRIRKSSSGFRNNTEAYGSAVDTRWQRSGVGNDVLG